MLIGTGAECSFSCRKGLSLPTITLLCQGAVLCQWCCLLEVTKNFSELHCSSTLQKQEHHFQHPSKFSSTQQWSAAGCSSNVNTWLHIYKSSEQEIPMPPSSLKTEMIVRIKIIHGNAWLGVFHAKYKATYLKPFYPGLHGHKSSNQFRSLWMLRSPVLHWIWTISYLVTMLNYYWQWLIHNSFSYFLKSKDKSFLLFHHHIFFKFLFLQSSFFQICVSGPKEHCALPNTTQH